MSLRVWLPLNGTLDNQGLDDVVVTNNGATIDNNGKIGKCYNFSGSNYLYFPYSFPNEDWSYGIWFYTTDTTTQTLGCCRNGVGFGFSVFLISNKLRIDGVIGQNIQWTTSYTFPTNVWVNLIITSKNGLIKYYINGEYQSSKTVARDISKLGTIFSIGASQTNGSGWGNFFKGKINDVRIYDHALSSMEVKQISQGLILHYPLNNNGFGQKNLLKNSNFLQGTNGMKGYTVTSSATCTKQTDCMKVVSTKASGGFYTSNFNSITTGDMTTFSTDVKADNNMTVYIGTDGSGNNNCQAYTVGTSWQRISISKTKTTNNANLRVYGNGTFYVKNLKYELGSIATPWCPNEADELYNIMGLNNNIQYDTSGYNNNGIRTGAFSWISDTPKYSVNQVFSGNQYIVEPNEINTTDSTIALWIKSTLNANKHILDARNSSGVGKQPIYQYTNGSIQTGGNNVYVTTNAGLLVANTWVHVVLVQSGNSLLVYKNGILFQTMSCNNSPIIKPTVGARFTFSSKYIGQLSDLRIYVTALSAEDIKSLYQNSAYIDNQGNIYGTIYEEV